jgi:hypothetical protein
MAARLEDPFDPDEFGNLFAAALAKITDDGECDGGSDIHTWSASSRSMASTISSK